MTEFANHYDSVHNLMRVLDDPQKMRAFVIEFAASEPERFNRIFDNYNFNAEPSIDEKLLQIERNNDGYSNCKIRLLKEYRTLVPGSNLKEAKEYIERLFWKQEQEMRKDWQ